MAVQFPNFLGVPVRTPDYSGFGDVVNNFYAGKLMPKDDLIKAIQAKFAEPNAEAVLKQTQLSNQKSGLEIQKMGMEMAQQREFERQLRQAMLSGTAPPSSGAMSGGQSAPMPQMNMPSPVQNPRLNLPQNSQNGLSNNINSALADQFSQIPKTMDMPQQADSIPTPQSAPMQPSDQSPPDQMQETEVTKGSPNLAAIDKLYDTNPLSREFLEKKGYKKKQEIKFNSKTGQTSVITTYPSGRVTIQNMLGGGGTGEAPLTNRMVTKHQNVISSIDNALPIIQKILDQPDGWEPYPRSSGYYPGMGYVPGWQGQSTKYEALVSSALDTMLGAYGLPMSNEGLDTVKKQLIIGHGETDSAYKKRLKELVEDLKRRKAYSANEVKKSLKNPPMDGGMDAVSSMSDDELREAAANE